MPDYNIYIHAIGSSGSTSENPTVPWSARQNGGGFSPTSSKSSGGGNFEGMGANVARSITKAASYMQNPDSLVSSGLGVLAKASPWIVAAMAVIKLGESVANNVVEFSAIETGDYTRQVQLNDIKSMMRLVTHPFSTLVQGYKIERQWARENQRLTAERDLLGDSVINSYTGRGV